MAPSIVLPETFTRAVGELRAVSAREEIALEEVPAPKRLAPFAYAVGATVLRHAEEVATGRLILLHDPDGHEAWTGTLRLVTYVTAELEPDLAADQLLPAVGWSWLTDALDAQGATYTAIGGTITQTVSTPFGELASRTSQPSGELASRTSQPSGNLASPTGQSSGDLAGPIRQGNSDADIEIRASWTPLGGDLGAHMRAWCTLLASTAGLPPPGVTALR
jgi:hypothetical protein